MMEFFSPFIGSIFGSAGPDDPAGEPETQAETEAESPRPPRAPRLSPAWLLSHVENVIAAEQETLPLCPHRRHRPRRHPLPPRLRTHRRRRHRPWCPPASLLHH